MPVNLKELTAARPPPPTHTVWLALHLPQLERAHRCPPPHTTTHSVVGLASSSWPSSTGTRAARVVKQSPSQGSSARPGVVWISSQPSGERCGGAHRRCAGPGRVGARSGRAGARGTGHTTQQGQMRAQSEHTARLNKRGAGACGGGNESASAGRAHRSSERAS